MLTGEVIQRVQSAYSKGVQSDDSRLSDRYIYNHLLTVRSLLLYQKLNKKQKVSRWAEQVLPCVEMIPALPYECPCLPPVGCTILKTKYPLPEPISTKEGHIINSVTSLLGDIVFSEVSWEGYQRKRGAKYTSNKPDYFIRGNHLFITQKKDLPRVITITGVFYNPTEIESYPSFCNEKEEVNDCYNPYEDTFHIDPSLLEPLISMTKDSIMRDYLGRVSDRQNDNNDEIQNEEEQRRIPE